MRFSTLKYTQKIPFIQCIKYHELEIILNYLIVRHYYLEIPIPDLVKAVLNKYNVEPCSLNSYYIRNSLSAVGLCTGKTFQYKRCHSPNW